MKTMKILITLFSALLITSFAIVGCSQPQISQQSQPQEQPVFEVQDLPAPPPDPIENKVAEKIASMTLEEKACALFVGTPEILGGASVYSDPSQLAAGFKQYPLSGICWFASNMPNPESVQAMLSATSQAGGQDGFAVLQCLDEEGGTVTRIAFNPLFNATDVGDARLATEGGTQRAYDNGIIIGSYLSPLGFNVDFAPVADVAAGSWDFIYNRSFSQDPNVAADMVASEIAGLASAGIVGCPKHFPGIGGSAGDTHAGTVIVDSTREQLDAVALVPFKKAVDSGAKMIMVGHAEYPAIDSLPASCSPAIISILRNDLGFDGIIITDSQQMGAVSDLYGSGEATLRSLEAGADLVLIPMDFIESRDAIIEAVQTGRLSEERINQSLERILRLRAELAG